MRNRKEHLDWCKKRAIEYIDNGDPDQAWTSMMSDLGKNTETAGHSAITLGMMLKMNGHLSTSSEMREFINGFN